MRRILFLIFSLCLISCSSTQQNINFQSKRVGVHYSINEELKLCYSHLGVTVFQNESKEYTVNENFNDLITKGYIKGINQSGSIAVSINSNINWADFLTYSSWDGSAKLNPIGQRKLMKLGKEENLDFIVIARDYIEVKFARVVGLKQI